MGLHGSLLLLCASFSCEKLMVRLLTGIPGIMEGLGLFIYGTGSLMDFKVGLSVSELSLAGSNATKGDGELAFGTSFL